MADEQIVTSIVANSDFSNLIADVQRVTGSLSRLQQEFAGANRALAGQINAANAMFSETMRKTGQFSTHFVSLTSDVEKFGRNLDSGRLKLRDYFRVYQENVRTSGGLIRDLAKQQVQLQNAVLQPLGRNAQGLMQYNVHIPRGLDLTKNKAALLKQELQIMNKVIQDGGVQLINWGKNTQWAGRQLTVGLTLPLAAFGKAAADAFRQADQELTRLTKVYGDVAGTSAQELGRVRKEVAQTAKELSAAMGVNFSETIGLAADIAATGKTGNDLLASVKETTRLAVLGEVDRQDAMKATLALQSAFKTNTEDLADSINFLNAVENQTSTSLNDLVEAIPKAGPVIKGLGGDVKDLALYLTAMREGGVSASEGANALKSALASLINPTDVAVAKFKSFGIDLLGIVSKNAGSTTDTLFALQAALDKLNPLQKQQAIEQLFGKFQFARLNALFENLGRQGSQTLQVLDLMKASASDLQAVAGRELAQVTESASGRYKRALESLKAELAGVGDQFLDIGTKLINILTKVLDFAQKLPDPIKKLLAFGGAFTAIIGPVIMLTGVLANFFGYIIKGLGHFKALFKGAEGFKLLTPEIMAAKAASSQLADEFYSDALAADTLSAAIKKLNNDLRELQLNASTINANPAAGQVISTIAGNPLMTMGGPRVVAAQHPLLGGRSRAAAHLNPRDPNNPATIFGLTLQPIPVNQRIGRNPQILMNDRLQDIEGLTTIKGSSTGVVASEHARYAALMATLGMQSKQEIEQLKETIGLGGQVSSEFIATFDDILPLTQKLTQNAASQSAAIVAELKAGKINVEQAKAAIIAVNADLERMLGVQVTQYAVSRGRTIDLTKAPLIDQPVVDVQGKPNTRGMFRQGIFGKVMSAVGRATRTRTFGGPYSIETTRPPGLNRGGNIRGYTNGEFVYMTNGETVPGPNVNADVVPAMLTPGEFVLTRGTVQREGSDAVEALHRGEATIVPIQRNAGGSIPNVQYLNQAGPVIALADIMSRRTAIGGSRAVGISSAGHARTSGYNLLHTENALAGGFGYANFAGTSFWNSRAGKEMTRLYGVRGATTVRGSRAQSEVNIHAISSRFTSRFGRGTGRASTPDMLGSDLIALGAMGNIDPTKKYRILPAMSLRGSKEFNEMLPLGKADASMWQKISGSNLTDLAFYLHHTLKLPPNVVNNILEATANRINYAVLKNPNKKFTENDFGDIVFDSIENAMQYQINSKTGNWIGLNSGGRVPGFARGGSFAASSYMYRRALAEGNLRPNVLPKSYLLKALGAKFSIRPGGKGYDITSLPVNPDLSMFDGLGLSPQGQKIVYNELVQRVASMKPQTLDRNVKKGFGLHDIDSLWGGTVGFLDPTKLSNPKDRLIIKEFAERTGRMQMGMPPAIVKKLFGGRKLNRGGSAYPRYGYARGVQHKLPGGPILKFLAMLGIPLLGQEVGNRVGGTAGSAISTGSLLASMFMMPGMPGRAPAAIGQKLGFAANESALSPMRQSIFAQGTPVVGRFATSLGTAATSGSKFAQVASKMLIGISRLNVAIGIGTAAVYAGVKAWQNYKRTQELSAAEFGLTADQAEKAGLKYVSYTDKLAKAAEAQKIFRTQLEMAYKSMASAGTPFNLTINEYEKLKQEVKDTMQTQIDLVNAVDDKDLAKIATRLKIQFMAAGMSADEAAKKIYTLLQLSDKASQTINAITTKDFLSITNPQQAATKAIESFNYAAQFENSKDAAFAFNTALQAIDASISDTYSKNEKDAKKKKQNFDEIEQLYIAEKNTLSDINAKVKDQAVLGNDVVDELAKQNPEIKKIIGGQDTILSSWQKIKIAAMGYTGVLSNLGAEQTDLLYKLSNALSQAVEQQNKAGLLKDQYDKLKILKDRYESYTKAAKGQSVQQQINARDAVKALDKQIAKINEAAEARKKALEEETQGQNMALEIQKKRTEYEKAVASGDFSGAAIAQLDLQQLLNEQQTTIATQQIEAARQAAVAPLEERKQALENAQQALADKAALASENLDSLAKQIENQKNKIDAVNKAMFAYRMAQLGVAGDIKTAGAGLVDAFKKSGVKVDEYTKKYVGSQLVTVKLTPQEILDKIFATDKSGLSIETILAQKDIIINGTRVIVNGKQLDAGGTGAKDSPYNLGKGSDIKYVRTTSRTAVTTTISDSQLQNPDNQVLKGISEAAKEKGYTPGQYITLTDSKGNSYRFLINKDSTVQKAALGKYIRGYNNGTTDGPVEGPGTGTSDSILAKLSNGEFVTKSSSVSDIGVDNMHLINTLGSQGVLKAAEKIVDGHARGGEVGSKKDSGSKTGYDSAKDYFKKLGDLSVNFATDKFDLQDSEKLELDDIAKKLEASGVKEFLVKGYADRRGSKAYNLQLSLRRAEAVANYLENILPNIRFVSMALGEENSSSSASAMSKKRRVSVELPQKFGGPTIEKDTVVFGGSGASGDWGGGGWNKPIFFMARGGLIPGYDKGGPTISGKLNFDLEDIKNKVNKSNKNNDSSDSWADKSILSAISLTALAGGAATLFKSIKKTGFYTHSVGPDVKYFSYLEKGNPKAILRATFDGEKWIANMFAKDPNAKIPSGVTSELANRAGKLGNIVWDTNSQSPALRKFIQKNPNTGIKQTGSTHNYVQPDLWEGLRKEYTNTRGIRGAGLGGVGGGFGLFNNLNMARGGHIKESRSRSNWILDTFFGSDDFTRAIEYGNQNQYGKAFKSGITGGLEFGTTVFPASLLAKVFQFGARGFKTLSTIKNLTHRTANAIPELINTDDAYRLGLAGINKSKMGKTLYFAPGEGQAGFGSYQYAPQLSLLEKIKAFSSKGFYEPQSFLTRPKIDSIPEGYIGTAWNRGSGLEYGLPFIGRKTGWNLINKETGEILKYNPLKGHAVGGPVFSSAPHDWAIHNPGAKKKNVGAPFEWPAYSGNNSFLKDMDTAYLGGLRGLYNIFAAPVIGSLARSTWRSTGNEKWNDWLYDAFNVGSLGFGLKAKTGIKVGISAAKAAEKIPFYGKHNIKKYSIPMEGEALRTNTAIKKLWSKISPTGVEFPKLVRTKLPQGVAGRYYGPEIEDIKGGTLQLPGLLQGLTANTATHEFLHHLDYVKTHASFRSFIDKYEKTNPEYIKELKDAFYAVEKIRPGLGYKKIEEMMSKLPDTELKSYFAGLKEGYATDTTFLLNKKFGGIGNPYIYDSGYYGSLREYLSSYRGITTPQYKLHPNMLQGILDKSPNMPETLRANYLKAIEFMKAENITPDLPVKDPAKYSDILAKALATKLKLNYGGYINPSYRPDMKIPSFETGIKYLYGDTIAQLHQKEAVLPADMNPFNPTATNPIGGGTYYIQPTINAAPGMDENMITDLAVQKVMNQLKDIDRRAGGNINMSNRYVRAGGIR